MARSRPDRCAILRGCRRPLPAPPARRAGGQSGDPFIGRGEPRVAARQGAPVRLVLACRTGITTFLRQCHDFGGRSCQFTGDGQLRAEPVELLQIVVEHRARRAPQCVIEGRRIQHSDCRRDRRRSSCPAAGNCGVAAAGLRSQRAYRMGSTGRKMSRRYASAISTSSATMMRSAAQRLRVRHSGAILAQAPLFDFFCRSRPATGCPGRAAALGIG